jgi:ribonuclease E
MTFYEAALRVLEESGAPLHSTDITKRAIDKNLLSHVGKTPEVTMLARLAAMAKRPRDRKILVTAKDTFALADWLLSEDADALAQTGIFEPNPEESLPPYRSLERHPEPHAEYLRAIGRQADRKRGRDDDGKRKKFPPVAEVVFELLEEGRIALVPAELLARLKARDLVEELNTTALIDALADDNQKRVDQGRRPNFAALRADSGELQISVEPQSEGGPSALDLQQAFCAAVGLGFENGRVVLKSQRVQRERGDRHERAERGERAERTVDSTGPAVIGPEDLALLQAAKHAAKDARRALARVFRRKLAELDQGTFEKACVRMLHGLHFRELKVARRSKEGPTLTGRRKDGSLELRYAIRLVKGAQPVDRRLVQELRRELGNFGANLGLIVSTGETRSEARSEAVLGSGMVLLWCGDALAERFFEAKTGVHVTQVELYDLDEAFFALAQKDAEEALKRREERHRERDQQPRSSVDASAQPTPPMDAGADTQFAPAPAIALSAPGGAGFSPVSATNDATDAQGDDEGEEEGPEGSGAETGAPVAGGDAGAEGRRRRRRRRRRRGRGDAPAGQTAAGETPVAVAGTPGPIPEAAPSEASEAVPTQAAAPQEPVSSEPLVAASTDAPPPPEQSSGDRGPAAG